jgi:hypothetical protein
MFSTTTCTTLRQEKTLADLMRAAGRKSRRFSSPKSTATLREITLQNRMVIVVNDALAKNSLNTPVSSLDVKKPAFKFSPYAAVFTPAPAAADANAFSLQSVDSEELEW